MGNEVVNEKGFNAEVYTHRAIGCSMDKEVVDAEVSQEGYELP